MSIFKRVACAFGAVIILVCSLCIPAFASDLDSSSSMSELSLEDVLASSPSAPYLYYFTDGGFYWLNGHVTSELRSLPVQYSPAEWDPDELIPNYDGCPEYISVDGVSAYFKRAYPDSNVYEFVVAGASAGYYSLLDIDGTGYYTALMGSPCEYAYLTVVFPREITGLKSDIKGYLRSRIYNSADVSGLFAQSKYLTFTDNVWVEWDNDTKKLTAYYDVEGVSYSSVCGVYHFGDSGVDSSSLPAPFYAYFADGITFDDIDTSGAGQVVFLYGGGLEDGKQILTKSDITSNDASTSKSYEFRAYGITPTYTILSSISSVFRMFVGWVGEVVTYVVSSPILTMFSIGIAVGLFGLIFVLIRKFTWGA